MAGISEKEVICILQKRGMLLTALRTKKKIVYAETNSINEQIQKLIQQKEKLHDTLSISDDNSDRALQVLEQQQTRYKQELAALKTEAESFSEQEQLINKVWLCFRCLPLQDFELLNALYVKSEKWDVVAIQQGISKTTIRKRRKSALEKLIVLINSERDDVEYLRILSKKFIGGEKQLKIPKKEKGGA